MGLATHVGLDPTKEPHDFSRGSRSEKRKYKHKFGEKMKVMIDGVFYNKEIIDFENILKGIIEIVGEDIITRSLEFPEIGAVVGDTYYYRCGFTLDKEIDEMLSRAELDEIKEKIKNLFPEDTIVYSLNCEIYE